MRVDSGNLHTLFNELARHTQPFLSEAGTRVCAQTIRAALGAPDPPHTPASTSPAVLEYPWLQKAVHVNSWSLDIQARIPAQRNQEMGQRHLQGKAPLGYSCRLALASCCHFPGLRCAFFVEKVNTTTENSSKEPQTGQNEVKTRCLDNLREKETETAACRHSWALMCAGGCCEHFHELPYLNFQTLL